MKKTKKPLIRINWSILTYFSMTIILYLLNLFNPSFAHFLYVARPCKFNLTNYKRFERVK